MRTNIAIKLQCALCGDLLEAESETSKIECNSADNITSSLKILPCKRCYEKQQAPLLMIREALDNIKNIRF